MKIVVIGTGYVGLVAGACFADAGHTVTCVENDPNKLSKLFAGEVYFYEPGLQTLVSRHFSEGNLFFRDSLAEALPGTRAVFLAVGTPEGKDGQVELSYVYEAARQIGQLAAHPLTVVIKSTVPVGTQKTVSQIIQRELRVRGSSLHIEVASNPEFLRQGAAIEDFVHPDRVIIGTESPEARDLLLEIYAPIVSRDKIVYMDPASAEMTKYVANAFLATKISFINEISNICDLVGANIEMVSKGIGMDRRISPHFLNAGIGYGGSCFPKDVKALISEAKTVGYTSEILNAVHHTNEQQGLRIIDKFVKVMHQLGKEPKNLQIAVWGLSFKPETDDMRKAPSRVIIQELLKLGCRIVAYDPQAMSKAEEIFGTQITYASSALAALAGSQALFLLTEWKEFLTYTPEEIRERLDYPLVLDGRNVYNPQEMAMSGLYYVSMGRPTYAPEQQMEKIAVSKGEITA